ncbi:Hypothetical_protein [Hexamita inflata]|uniref:Hypothetical_protein n=1 Tax=Hexamita inflata TaxID=28002 RepID=A0AA86U9E6_9EUKA|nr:Hypothetical protein HINF_LOCUS21888 [Hexamita inflata]
MKEALKKYTVIQCSHGGTMNCFFRQVNSHVTGITKNKKCTRHIGKRSFTVKTYIKDNVSYTNYKYFVNNEQNLIDCSINTAKRMDSQTRIHAVLFKGAHSFNDLNSPCNQNIINVNQYNSQERNILNINIVHYVSSQEFTFNSGANW